MPDMPYQTQMRHHISLIYQAETKIWNNYSPPALRLRAAQRAGGHDTTLKKLNRTREDPDPLPQQQLFSVSRKFLFVSFRFVFFS